MKQALPSPYWTGRIAGSLCTLSGQYRSELGRRQLPFHRQQQEQRPKTSNVLPSVSCPWIGIRGTILSPNNCTDVDETKRNRKAARIHRNFHRSMRLLRQDPSRDHGTVSAQRRLSTAATANTSLTADPKGDSYEPSKAVHRLKIYNTLTECIEPIPSVDVLPTKGDSDDSTAPPITSSSARTKLGLGWYTCGPTTYAPAHLGHARTYVCLDILQL